MTHRECRPYHLAIIFCGLIAAALYAYGHKVDGDVIQLLRNGHALVVKGELVPFGSHSSSGSSGNVPGAFLSLAVGLPMKIWHSPWASLIVLACLHLAALLMFLDVMKKFISPIALLALAVFFWLNPWRTSEIFLWNPGYIFFAAVFHFWTAYRLSADRSFLFSLLHALSIFLALQIHASFVILIFITLILLKMRAIQANWPGVWMGILLGIASLTPYLLAGIDDPNIFPQPGSGGKGYLFFGIINVYPLLKAFWYWILFGSLIFQKHIFHQLEYNWISPEGLQLAFNISWTAIKYIFGSLGVLASFYVNFRFFQSNKEVFRIWKVRFDPTQNWVAFYTVSAFFAAIAATAISPTLPIYWHLLYIWPFALIPLIFFLDDRLKIAGNVKKIEVLVWVCAVYFMLFNVVAALGSTKHSIQSSFDQTYHQICGEECRWPIEKSPEQ